MERTLKRLKACKAKRQASPPPAKLRKSGASDAFQKLNIIGCEPNINIVEEPKMTRAQWKSGQIEVQELGSHAVIKITDKWKRGIVMQIHLALEECKVDVLQSNVTTIGDNIVQFTTIQMNPGVTTNIKTIVDAIEKASTLI
ncbi:uncharacterized protein LOC131053794 [Cryptomeria japonica]|uniref:uncharacterized protein LOC131053794 n=1 Tax=Cryptomeria japonica TaxID=3369 RepID=UPI0025AC349C|nr:uncharacterized protein LOC131053794 [Cryptomeria japonica]